MHANDALVQRRGEDISISRIATGFDHPIQIRRGRGPEVRLILLSATRSRRRLENRTLMVLCTCWKLGKTSSRTKNCLCSSLKGMCTATSAVFPSVHGTLKLVGGNLDAHGVGETTHYTGSVPEEKLKFKIDKLRKAGEIPHGKVGQPLLWRPQGVAMAPDDSEFQLAAKWAISIPHSLQSSTISNMFLRIAYTGDVARLWVDGELLDDNFNNGTRGRLDCGASFRK